VPNLPNHAAAALAHARATAPAPPGTGFHLFAYGAMVATQPFPVATRTIARAHGHCRAWTLHDPVRRGTPERPGRVLGLNPDGACDGVALRIAPEHAEAALAETFAQELLLPWYVPAWLPLATPSGEITALAFLSDPASPLSAPTLSDDALAELIATTTGPGGPNTEYLRETAEGLRDHGIPDAELDALLARVEKHCPTAAET
jgi:cation transport protein ChaC